MKTNRIIALFICIMLVLTPLGAFAETSADTNAPAQTETEKEPILTNGELAKILVAQSANLIILKYKDEVTREQLYEETLMKIMEKHPELIEDAYDAMFSSLDEHSCYYTEEDYNYFMDNMSGDFVGIGVIISKIDDGLLVSKCTAESPAAEAGIRQGDIIVSADDVNIVGMEIQKARTYITGTEGTTVKIGVKRNGENLTFQVVRRHIIVESGSYEILPDNIGYIKLDSFDDAAPRTVDAALDAFDAKGITNIVFDLRFNAGGAVTSLTNICKRIIPSGPVIHFRYKDPANDYTLYSECQDPKYNLIVLANDYSASASEAFCGAVQDSGVGIVVGTSTYGKGTMQTLTKFTIGGGVKITVAEYLTRNERHIDGSGIKPDYYVEDKLVKLKNSGFNDLDYTTKPRLGDKSPNVLAINQRLWAMGYDVGVPGDVYTEKTKDAVYQFQAATDGLNPYGVCDISTQLAIEKVMQGLEFYDNTTFDTAIEIFKLGSLEEYKKHND